MTTKFRAKHGTRGHAVIEVSLMAPWIFFLFVGTLDFGFYAYAAISTENAARVAVSQTAQDTNTAARADVACTYAIGELRSMPNMQGVNGCVANPGSITSAQPVAVAATQINGVDGALASQVSVTYQTIQMIPIPGLVAGRYTLTRTAEMRLRDQ
jgi:Flp pilus assembly protein TadG